ncbi:MAG: 5'-methylthioadenosine/adenosylhomocysteine nucleosidase [Ruoffia tabacinasalis]|uniref:adenosylhomocysteine nucleosidase n=1 Tax=Ruoffia tabacinasalis TaxID=87458 RepID=A0A5R9EG43_9LACT|nr:5'-methylthioadenosine/adenosylhomocysteine nucleosidase [Ruoffia tabacinasalis]MBG9978460.1 5'-methylthioadenosine/adenosylhomocysteine nucleosidase [Ruoffia tabacinasalis]TLQ49346.1 5'-methylthioadenosine/adenosylhomocysteine nucleosidase [Ruoffia tabacinasalis]
MIIGLIGAMEEEIRELKKSITNQEHTEQFGVEFIKGNLEGKEVVLVLSGIGKVNVTITVTLLKQLFNVTHIINTGSAGALDSALEVGDIVIAHSLTYHDVDVTGFNYELGQMAGMPAQYYPDTEMVRIAQNACREIGLEPYIGQIVSGDQFVSTQEQKSEILNNFPLARAAEMESTAIAQAAYVMGVPFVIIRAISDSANDEASVTFDEFIVTAGKVSATMVMATVAAL